MTSAEIKAKIDTNAAKWKKITDNFQIFKADAEKYVKAPNSASVITLQTKVNNYISANSITGLTVTVYLYQNQIIFLGNNIASQIVWETLSNNGIQVS